MISNLYCNKKQLLLLLTVLNDTKTLDGETESIRLAIISKINRALHKYEELKTNGR